MSIDRQSITNSSGIQTRQPTRARQLGMRRTLRRLETNPVAIERPEKEAQRLNNCRMTTLASPTTTTTSQSNPRARMARSKQLPANWNKFTNSVLAIILVANCQLVSSQASQQEQQQPQQHQHQPQQQQQPQHQQQPQQPYCTLGDDTYQIGERWNPNLPPFGVQVCVLCECIVRQRKSCYEAKVTCRRITNECPVIDSCPDGEKPVTVTGQCCKSCQSTSSATLQSQTEVAVSLQAQPGSQMGSNQSPAYESQSQPKASQPSTSFRIVYMNERTKDYMSLVNSLPECPARDSDSSSTSNGGSSSSNNNNSNSKTQASPSQSAPPQAILPTTQAPKAAKGARNDLNGIDTRMAFKSLHDAASNYVGGSKTRPSTTASDASQQHQVGGGRVPSSGHFDQSSDDHQHPNDVQSATASNRNQPQTSVISDSYGSPGGAGGQNSRQPEPSSLAKNNSCKLGNDTFQVGDVWNPILPPLGVQVCVQCNCIFRVRKNCFETKVTCRRINRDCPILEVCPDGNPPVNVDGQCCKTCLSSNSESQLDPQQQQQYQQQSSGGANLFQPTTLPLNGIMRNEKVYRDFFALTRNLSICVKSRGSVDIYNTNRDARRARRTTVGRASSIKSKN